MEGDIARALLEWFRERGRRYPWRENRSPYRVLVAEIMLQRTRADQVLRIYNAFLERFPDVPALAKASPAEVRAFFERLGLNWRAGKVMQLAEILASKYGGRIPETRGELLSLPGVGEYAADAVLCFAYGGDLALVDANVCRIIGRAFGLQLRGRGEARRDPRIREIAQRLVPAGRAREFNWALIDLAALVCTPRNPKCDACPLKDSCMRGREQGGGGPAA